MNLQSKFGYFNITQTLNIALCLLAGRNYGQTDKRTDRQMDRQTNRRTIRLLDAPGGPLCGRHEILLSMLIPRYFALSVILRTCPWMEYEALMVFFLLVILMTSHLSGLKLINQFFSQHLEPVQVFLHLDGVCLTSDGPIE